MAGHATIEINAVLELRVASFSSAGTKSCGVRLNRLSAQALAEALRAFADGSAKSAGIGRSQTFGGIDVDPVKAEAQTRPAVHVAGGTKSRGVVRLPGR
jgi:hypothetical protein